MNIPTLIKAFEATADITGKHIVKFSDAANSNKIATADGPTAPLVGVADAMGAKQGGMCDVHLAGITTVKLGGAVAAGDPLTAAADGRAIKLVAGAGQTRIGIGFAQAPGVADDEIPAFLAPVILHQA